MNKKYDTVKTKALLAIASVAILLQSCTFTQRRYMPGFYVESNSKHIPKTPVAKVDKVIADQQMANSSDVPVASVAQPIAKQVSQPVAVTNNVIAKEKHNNISLLQANKKGSLFPIMFPSFTNHDKSDICALVTDDQVKHASGFAVASLIFGILAVISYYGAFLFGLLAIIFGAVALSNISNNPDVLYGRRMALAGILLGIIAIVVWAIVLLAVIAVVASPK